jgi:hypothetical protein
MFFLPTHPHSCARSLSSSPCAGLLSALERVGVRRFSAFAGHPRARLSLSRQSCPCERCLRQPPPQGRPQLQTPLPHPCPPPPTLDDVDAASTSTTVTVLVRLHLFTHQNHALNGEEQQGEERDYTKKGGVSPYRLFSVLGNDSPLNLVVSTLFWGLETV